jgi:predicted RNase H-like HicB family nuclease
VLVLRADGGGDRMSADPVAYTVRVHCADDEVPFWAEVDEHPGLTAFGHDLEELMENVAKGIDSLE